jgi:hypothetical protein
MKYITALILTLAFTAPAAAGEITRPDPASDFKWKSTECAKPIPKPAIGGQSKQDRLMAYATDIEIYIECIQREAQRDFQKAQADMQEALERDLEKDVQVMNDMMLNAAKTMR